MSREPHSRGSARWGRSDLSRRATRRRALHAMPAVRALTQEEHARGPDDAVHAHADPERPCTHRGTVAAAERGGGGTVFHNKRWHRTGEGQACGDAGIHRTVDPWPTARCLHPPKVPKAVAPSVLRLEHNGRGDAGARLNQGPRKSSCSPCLAPPIPTEHVHSLDSAHRTFPESPQPEDFQNRHNLRRRTGV